MAFQVCRDPNLLNRRVWADNELDGRVFELDKQRSRAEIGVKAKLAGGREQLLLQFVKCLIGMPAELLVVHSIVLKPVGFQHSAKEICYPWTCDASKHRTSSAKC